MSRMIQLRNVPADLHAILKARAALDGKTLSDYLVEQVRAVASRPTADEIRRRLSQRAPLSFRTSPTKLVRRERDAR